MISDFNVMLVEDEARIRRGLKILLEDIITGYQVSAEAANGKDALVQIMVQQPELIIVDIRMPVMNGIDFCEAMTNAFPHIPIVVLSGYDDFTYVRQALRFGVVDYLLKPVERIEFKKMLDKLHPLLMKNRQDHEAKKSTGDGLLDVEGSKVVQQIVNMIQKRFHEDISLQMVADEVNLSYPYLSHLFKTETGISFSKYVVKVRMENAKRLLKDTNMRIYEIANLCGYTNQKYFMIAFKQYTGTTARNYQLFGDGDGKGHGEEVTPES